MGKLYLIPTPIAEGRIDTIPQPTIDIIHQLRHFIAERAKTARHFIKATNPPYAIQELTVEELNKRTDTKEKQRLLQALKQGKDVGLMSEAGCPGVADPGAELVRLAHQAGIEVVPLVGPSSLLLALMASGMNGQSFSFHGYLPIKKPELSKELKKLEHLARRHKQTQLFIEAPYRNHQFLETAFQTLAADTMLGVAVDLTLPEQYVKTQTIAQWQKEDLPDLHKRPGVFMIF